MSRPSHRVANEQLIVDCLRQGDRTVRQIHEATGINRGTIIDVLHRNRQRFREQNGNEASVFI